MDKRPSFADEFFKCFVQGNPYEQLAKLDERIHAGEFVTTKKEHANDNRRGQ